MHGGKDGELTTPTGAALLATLAERFGPLPTAAGGEIGYGAGTKDLPHAPNLLRVFIGEDGTRAMPMSSRCWKPISTT